MCIETERHAVGSARMAQDEFYALDDIEGSQGIEDRMATGFPAKSVGS